MSRTCTSNLGVCGFWGRLSGSVLGSSVLALTKELKTCSSVKPVPMRRTGASGGGAFL